MAQQLSQKQRNFQQIKTKDKVEAILRKEVDRIRTEHIERGMEVNETVIRNTAKTRIKNGFAG